MFIQSRVGSQVIRNAKYKTIGKMVVNQSVIKTKNQKCKIIRQGLGRIRKQRGVLYNFSINWLTQNQHRIKINVQMGYKYTRRLNIL